MPDAFAIVVQPLTAVPLVVSAKRSPIGVPPPVVLLPLEGLGTAVHAVIDAFAIVVQVVVINPSQVIVMVLVISVVVIAVQVL